MAAPVPLTFADSERSTVGLEWELALVDTDSGELRQAATAVLDAVHAERSDDDPLAPQVTGELLLNTIEVSSGKCRTIGEAGAALAGCLDRVREVATPLRIELMGGGLDVTQTALALGYGSTSAFVFAFRSDMGCAPQAYMRGRSAGLRP